MQDVDLRGSVLKGFAWVGGGQVIGQLISWASTILVIRLLTPADYGLIAMSASFVWLLSMMSELGIGASIVQARQIGTEDIRRVYGLVILFSAAFVVVGHVVAPLVAAFYGEPRVTTLIRVTNLSFLLSALYVVPQSIAVRNLDFALKTKVDVVAQVSGAVLTVSMAVGGAGVWALALGPLGAHALRAAAFHAFSRQRVTPRFDVRSVARFVNYGLTITGDRLAYYLHTVSDTVILGRLLGHTALGTYSVALTLASLPAEKILPIVTQVSFASYSRIQDDRQRIARNVLRSIQMVSFVAFPAFFLMAAVAPEVLALLLGEKWSAIVVPFQVLCLIMPVKALSPILPPAVFAIGKPVVNLFNMVFTFVVMAAAFLVGVQYGVVGLCLAWVVVYPVVFLISTRRCARAIGLRLVDVLREIWFPFLASAAILALVMTVKSALVLSTHLVAVVMMLPVALAMYAALILLFRKNECLSLKHVLFG
jgi:O-antigen/teichoic acid export membrane protein